MQGRRGRQAPTWAGPPRYRSPPAGPAVHGGQHSMPRDRWVGSGAHAGPYGRTCASSMTRMLALLTLLLLLLVVVPPARAQEANSAGQGHAGGSAAKGLLDEGEAVLSLYLPVWHAWIWCLQDAPLSKSFSPAFTATPTLDRQPPPYRARWVAPPTPLRVPPPAVTIMQNLRRSLHSMDAAWAAGLGAGWQLDDPVHPCKWLHVKCGRNGHVTVM
jgi:hypothetical protein